MLLLSVYALSYLRLIFSTAGAWVSHLVWQEPERQGQPPVLCASAVGGQGADCAPEGAPAV